MVAQKSGAEWSVLVCGHRQTHVRLCVRVFSEAHSEGLRRRPPMRGLRHCRALSAMRASDFCYTVMGTGMWNKGATQDSQWRR